MSKVGLLANNSEDDSVDKSGTELVPVLILWLITLRLSYCTLEINSQAG